MTRQLIVAGSNTLLAPAYIHEEIERHVSVVVEKADKDHETVSGLADRLFEHITIAPLKEIVGRGVIDWVD
jgi:predicted nucleic acid-binding protein